MKSLAYQRLLAVILMAACVAGVSDNWDEAAIICPVTCVCQRSHLRDLAIAQWTGGMGAQLEANTWHLAEARPQHNHNEVEYDDDDDGGSEASDSDDADSADGDGDNPVLKQAMCMLADKNSVKDVLLSLPTDVEALVLLYNNGADKNITIFTSDLLASLPELTALELRSTHALAMCLVLDEPLPALRYANFETIELIGTQPATTAPHPSELFDYVPESERVDYNLTVAVDDEPIIVPYEVYAAEQRLAKMASFAGWHQLRVLRLHACQLPGAELHWQMFEGLQQLRHLSLEANQLETVPAFALFGAPNLRTLSLAGNRIAELNYRALAGLLRLQRLDLSANRLAVLSELTFPPFPKLRALDVRDNPIRTVRPMTFGVMNGTRHVHLGSAAQALELRADAEVFRSLAELRTLRIANVTARWLSAGVFAGLRSVRSVRLRGQLRRIEFDAFAGLVSMRELVLSWCALEALSMDTFFGTRDLEVVDMSNNRLTTLPFGLFDGQTRLAEVYLQGNMLGQLPGDIFARQSLRLMRLTDNPWQCSCKMATFWRQKITNAARRGRINHRCITDLSGNGAPVVRCNDNRNQFEYGYDAQLTPRCASGPPAAMDGLGGDDVAGRGVYYSMRKTLQCSRVLKPQQPAGRRVAPTKAVATAAAVVAVETAQQLAKRRQLAAKKQQLMRRKQNELRYQLHRQRKAQEQRLQMVEHVATGSNEMGNDLFGHSDM